MCLEKTQADSSRWTRRRFCCGGAANSSRITWRTASTIERCWINAIRSKEAETLLALQATNKRLQQENIQLNADVARLASILQTLNDEIARLRAVGTGKVVELVRQ